MTNSARLPSKSRSRFSIPKSLEVHKGSFEELIYASLRATTPELVARLRKLVLDNHITEEKLSLLLPYFTRAVHFSRCAEDFLLQVIDNTPHPHVRGAAMFRLATGYLLMSDLLEYIGRNDVSLEQYLAIHEYGENANEKVDAASLRIGPCLRLTASQYRSEADELLSAARADYGKEKVYSVRIGVNQTLRSDLKGLLSRQCDYAMYQLENLQIGSKMPRTMVLPTNGVDLEDLAGSGAPTIIDFWATNCRPCVEKIKYLEELCESGASNGVRTACVNVTESRNETKMFLGDYSGHLLHYVLGPQKNLPKQWGIASYPTLFLVDHNGFVCDKGPNLRASAIDHFIENQSK